jgi:hypothetical protein
VRLARGEAALADHHLRTARQRIDQFGYERRRRELDVLERRGGS